MLILALTGSPRTEGISSSALTLFSGPIRDAGIDLKIYNAYSMDIAPCTACGVCSDGPQCIFKDDMETLYQGIRKASGIIIASPIFFSSLPGPLKNIIDRCQLFYEEKKQGRQTMKGKKGAVILAGGSRYITMGQSSTIILKHFFNTIDTAIEEADTFIISDTDKMELIDSSLRENLIVRGKKYLSQVIENENTL